MTQDTFSKEPIPVKIPDLKVEKRPIQLVNWLIPPSTEVIAGERIAELLVDSVLFHLEAEHNGLFLDYLVPSGSQVQVDQVIAEIQVEND